MNKEIKLKFSLPFKRDVHAEERRLKHLNNDSATFFSPYINVIIVVDGEEICQPVGCIHLQEIGQEELDALPTNIIWDHAEHLRDLRSDRDDQVAGVEYSSSDKKVTFLWRNVKTDKVYSCAIGIDLG